MATTAEKIVENFPHKTIQSIIGQPTYETLAILHLILNTNAASVHSNRGNGQLGLIFLTLNGAVYATLSETPFVPPVNPGQNPDMTLGVTGPQIAEIRRKHKEALDEFATCNNTDKALKSQLIAAAEETCLRAKRNKHTGCANVTAKELLEHLHSSYAKITRGDLRDNEARMNQPCDSSRPIEVLFDQIEDAIDYAAAGNAAFTTQQIVNTACNLACDTGVFADECKAWRKKEHANQTWAEFQRLFTEAHQDLQESRATSRSSGHANFATQESPALEALTQLANAATADRTAMATLTAQVQHLQEENSKLQAKLVTALEKLAASGRPTPSGRTPRGSTFEFYCWTCGPNSTHKGINCRNKREGHQDSATAENMMEGKATASNRHRRRT